MKQTLVFLHGYPLNHTMWNPQREALQSKYNVITPDFAGFGNTPARENLSMESYADDLAAQLDEQGLEKITLIGFSMGGYVAFAFLRKYPEKVQALVLVDTQAKTDTLESRENRLKQVTIVQERGVAPIRDTMLDKLFSNHTKQHHPEIVRIVDEMIMTATPEGVQTALQAMANRPDMVEFLPSIRIPTLVFVGEDDVITPLDAAKLMADRIPNAHLHTIPNAGHLSNFEQTQAFNSALENFLTTAL
ncbi:alpha/beta fold hydrolase [Tumebacillus sp. ITR2]|uniref:Alpha/beta fold hydrolase n=1 Tax=Tumebacillus amylolyticus TaxID=2801339 RepID=A0ABS1J5Z1_9BACL|nr:alpha/beta fold hydrolase [Tumebacillus amylolyticus]MBL0385701.1 alpha/beta fold hydrolase [Tumebacillus amylolyticus]